MICETVTEEDVATALSPIYGTCGEFRGPLPRWLSRCCEPCSGKVHRVLRIQELMGLAGVRDSYDAWYLVEKASRGRGEPSTEVERLASVVALLMAEERLRFESPPEGLDAAEEAYELVAGLEDASVVSYLADAETGRLRDVPVRRPGLLALVQARYGNALRYGSRLSDGLMWTARAALIVRSCEVAPFVRAEVHSLAASAHLDSGQLQRALPAIRESIAAYESLGDLHRAGVERIQLAEILFQSGNPAPSVLKVIEEAVAEIDCLRTPLIHYGCCLNLAYYQLKSHRSPEAKAALEKLPVLGLKILDLRRRGLHAAALIAASDDYEAANLGLLELIQEYSRLDMLHDAATLMLYRGEALIRLGNLDQGRIEVANAYEIFHRLDAEKPMKQAFGQMVRWAHRAASDELIAGIRWQADLLGGCLPSIKPQTARE